MKFSLHSRELLCKGILFAVRTNHCIEKLSPSLKSFFSNHEVHLVRFFLSQENLAFLSFGSRHSLGHILAHFFACSFLFCLVHADPSSFCNCGRFYPPICSCARGFDRLFVEVIFHHLFPDHRRSFIIPFKFHYSKTRTHFIKLLINWPMFSSLFVSFFVSFSVCLFVCCFLASVSICRRFYQRVKRLPPFFTWFWLNPLFIFWFPYL